VTVNIERPAPVATRIGQGTAVEQSRAVAQVQAAVLIAQQRPRDVPEAMAEMRESCKQRRLAEKAFWRFPRGGKQVSGESIHLARELARCWGHIDYGIAELRRDDTYMQSEMIAFAWDMQRNTRNSSAFIVPHTRGNRDQPLVDTRDIYENNANNGARRVREAIFAVLPRWFIDEAVELCTKTLEGDSAIPLATRIANAVEKFSDRSVSLDQLEAKVGLPRGRWTAVDLAQLTVIYGSLTRGEVQAEDEFPPRRVTGDEITASVPAVKQQPQKVSTPPRQQPTEPPDHTDHDPAAIDSDCPGCAYDTAEANRKAEAE
jgi:hypothetical protein